MMYLKKKQPLLIFLSAILLLTACKKNSDKPAPPVTEPLTVAASRAGDTLIIKGQNFSEVPANDIVKFNGTEATVVSATSTELKVIVPANATSGSITVTVNGNTIEVGNLVVNPFTLYCIKENRPDPNTDIRQLVSIDPATSKESLIITLSSIPDFDGLNDFIYLAATNEVVGVDDDGRNLLKVNVNTKQTSSITLSTSNRIEFRELVTDKNGTVYAVKIDWTQQPYAVLSLEQLDINTGKTTTIKTVNPDTWFSLVYLPAKNEVAGLTDAGMTLFRVNLTTKDTSSVSVTTSSYVRFLELVTDNHSNLYGYQIDQDHQTGPYTYPSQLMTLDPTTGSRNTLIKLSDTVQFHQNLSFIPATNEITGVLGDTRLFHGNISTKASSVTPLTTQQNITYGEITSN